MNTKRLFFGFLAIAFLAMTAVSTNVIDVDEDQTVNVRKGDVPKH